MSTVYQFCNPCNRERAHRFKTADQLVCTSCERSIKVHYHTHKLIKAIPEDAEFMHQLQSGDGLPKVARPRAKKVNIIPQPVALLAILRGGRV